MAGNKYLQIGPSGRPQEVISTQTSSGVSDANKIVSLNTSGVIDATMLPESPTFSVVASEDVAAGDLINLWNDAGTLKMRKADNTSTAKRASGFIESAVTTGNSGSPTIAGGVCSGLTGLTLGADYFLGTSGGVTTTPPTASGSIVQYVGVAKSATELVFVPGDAFERV